MKHINVAMILVLFIMAVTCDNNDHSTDEGRIFRTIKYNDIWKRAVKKLKKEELEDLRKLLKKLDKTELNIKHMKGSGEEYDKTLEHTVRNHLADILERYHLYDGTSKKDFEKLTFEDTRLNQMWIQALKEESYSVGEIESLHQELSHMNEKINEYKTFSDKIDKHERFLDDEVDNELDVNENFVNAKDSKEQSKKLKYMIKERKDKYHTLNSHVQTLEQKVYDRVSNPDIRFTDPRVIELWDIAKRSGKFSDANLESIEEELQHFQNRINKLRHWERLGDKGEDETAQDKIRQHKKYVKKYHATMLDRVYEHTEL